MSQKYHRYHKLQKSSKNIINAIPQQLQKKQYYITFHNKLNVQHRNRQFKNIYLKLTTIHEPKDSYKMLYHIDIVHVINKLLKQYIINKDSLVTININTLISKAHNSIQKIYKLFILDDSVTNDQKKINFQYQSYINQFFNVLITFNFKLCIIYLMQNKVESAKKCYQIIYKLSKNITSSLTSNYKLLRKISQFYIVYAVCLMNSNKIKEAIKVLFQAINNQANMLIIMVWRGKSKNKNYIKRRKIEIYNRLFAIFLNLSTCYQQSCKIHLSYLCLKQCQVIGQLKHYQIHSDIKIMWSDLLKQYRQNYNDYIQLKKIVQVYFDKNALIRSINQYKKYQVNHKMLENQQNYQNGYQNYDNSSNNKDNINQNKKNKKNYLDKNTLKSINLDLVGQMLQNQVINVIKPKKRISVRRSLSLQDNLTKQNNQRLLKDFGHQLLFFGTDIFSNKIDKKSLLKPKSNKIKSNLSSFLYINPSTAKLQQSYLKNKKNNDNIDSKLKKRPKKIQNNLFRKIQQPLSYDTVQKNIQQFWNEQHYQNNKLKQKKVLLQYKNQYINNKKLIQQKQQRNINDQIQIINKKQKVIYKQNKNNQLQDIQKQSGIHLFKKIILKNMKNIDVKKNQLIISVLKKKRQSRINYNACSYSQPQFSIDYLIEKIKKQKNREELIQKIKNQEKNQLIQMKKFQSKSYNHMFLSKNRQIPNLFLSYISTAGFSGDGQALKTQNLQK